MCTTDCQSTAHLRILIATVVEAALGATFGEGAEEERNWGIFLALAPQGVHRRAIRRMSQCWSEDWLRLWWGVMVPGDAASPDVSFLFWVPNRNRRWGFFDVTMFIFTGLGA